VNPGYDVELEWGEQGVEHLALRVDAIVIVDVLSFTTCVDVAVARGARVVPGDASDVVRAVRRSEMTAEHPYSLSPPSLRDIPPGTRLALPSPNGATLTRKAAEAPGVDGLDAGLRCLPGKRGAVR
jgi:2-phosphosulfolactate phosphatase